MPDQLAIRMYYAEVSRAEENLDRAVKDIEATVSGIRNGTSSWNYLAQCVIEGTIAAARVAGLREVAFLIED